MRLLKKGPSVVVATLLLLLAAGTERAAAQGASPDASTVFLNVNFGAQPKARQYAVSEAFTLYDEPAAIGSTISTGSGSLFDISAGYRVWQDLSIAVGVSRYSDSSSTTVNATIPDPLFTDRPHASSITLNGLDHSERATHLSFVYRLPLQIIDKLDLSVWVGPSFFSLKKDLPANAVVAPGGTTLTSVDKKTVSESATGGHFGIDISYMVTKMIGAGLFVRTSSASVDVEGVDGGKVDVGGVNYGAGLRVRF